MFCINEGQNRASSLYHRHALRKGLNMTDYSRRVGVSGIRAPAVLNIHAFTVTEGYLCMWLPSLCKPELQHQSAASSRVLRPEVLKTSCLRSAAAAAENPETQGFQ